jgi:tetratricopeptide (TPR) repeat protein
MGDSDKAIEALEKAIKYDPNFVQALATKGSAHFQRGELDEAQRDLEKAVQLQPMFGPAWNNLALVHAEKGEWSKADACAKKAQESGYEVPEAFLQEIAGNL